MRPPRLSVNATLAAVAVFAIYCMAFRSIHVRPWQLVDDRLSFFVLGSLPMANVLSVGLVLMFRSRGRSLAFWRGFEACGGLAVFANMACFLRRPAAYTYYLQKVVDFLGDPTGLNTSPTGVLVEESLLEPALLLMPQLALALTGGWFARGITTGGLPAAPDPGPARHRGRLGPLCVVLALVAAPALVIEGILRWTVDPPIARLAEGSEATLGIEDSVGYAPFADSSVLIRCGDRVRVDDDPDRSWIGSPMNDGSGPTGDIRQVRITVLEGAAKGRSAKVHRLWLRPIP